MDLVIKQEFLDIIIDTPRAKNYVLRFLPKHLYQHVYSFFPHLFIDVTSLAELAKTADHMGKPMNEEVKSIEDIEIGLEEIKVIIPKTKKKKNDTPKI